MCKPFIVFNMNYFCKLYVLFFCTAAVTSLDSIPDVKTSKAPQYISNPPSSVIMTISANKSDLFDV